MDLGFAPTEEKTIPGTVHGTVRYTNPSNSLILSPDSPERMADGDGAHPIVGKPITPASPVLYRDESPNDRRDYITLRGRVVDVGG